MLGGRCVGYKPWMMNVMEEYGHTTTSTGLINRVALYLVKSSNDVIDITEFRKACYACNVDLDSFTQKDLEQL